MQRSVGKLWIAALTVLIAALPVGASASNGEKPYSDGPIKASDFQGTPPKPLPVADGVTVKSETAVALTIDKAEIVTTSTPNPDGSFTVVTSTKPPAASAAMDRTQSWIDPTSSSDAGLVDHEQGHLDITEKHARALQAQYNAMNAKGELSVTQTLAKGATADDFTKAAEAAAKTITKRIDDAFTDVNARDAIENTAYDSSTKHGTVADEQKKARDAQRRALEDPSKRDANKKGPEAKSAAGKSLGFDAATGRLRVTGDMIVGVDPRLSGYRPDPGDPLLGAEVHLPSYTLSGRLLDGTFFFSKAAGEGPATIVAGTQTLFSVMLDYLLYEPDDNLLFGLGTTFDATTESDFIAGLVGQLTTGSPALFGIEIHPQSRLDTATSDFTASASMSVTNGLGARNIPEAGTIRLVLLGLACLWVTAARSHRLRTRGLPRGLC